MICKKIRTEPTKSQNCDFCGGGAISRYKMCSIQNVNTLGGSSNKLPSKITEASGEKPKHPKRDFYVFVRVTKVDIREQNVNSNFDIHLATHITRCSKKLLKCYEYLKPD
jgi:hypothetical protein